MIKKDTINIRKANINDLELLLTWGRKMYKTEKHYMPLLKYSSKEARERYKNQIDNPLFYFLIAELNNKPVGYLYAHLDQIPYLRTKRKECEAEVIYLEKQGRGKGISQKLIASCVTWAKKNNALGIKAGIFANNITSIKTFQKSGFSLRHTTYFRNL